MPVGVDQAGHEGAAAAGDDLGRWPGGRWRWGRRRFCSILLPRMRTLRGGERVGDLPSKMRTFSKRVTVSGGESWATEFWVEESWANVGAARASRAKHGMQIQKARCMVLSPPVVSGLRKKRCGGAAIG